MQKFKQKVYIAMFMPFATSIVERNPFLSKRFVEGCFGPQFQTLLSQGCHMWIVYLTAFFSIGITSVSLASTDPFEAPIVELSKVRPENVVRIKAVSFDLLQGTGDVRKATVQLETREGFKLYSKGLTFNHVSSAQPFPEPMEVESNPPAKFEMDPWYNEERGTHYSGTIFTLVSKSSMTPNDSIRVRFEACSVNSCLLPTTFVISPLTAGSVAKFEKPQGENPLGISDSLSDSAFSTNAPGAVTPASEQNEEKKELSNDDTMSLTDRVSLWVSDELRNRSFLLFPALFLAGLLMNATPCVYPVIPITVNVLGRFGNTTGVSNGDRKNKRKKIYPWIYVLGMVLAYSAMGVVAAMTGGIFGQLLQNTAVVVAVSILMFVMGLWMLGVFSSTAIQNLAYRLPVSEKRPALGVLTMGAVSGLVSAPCTGPVLSTLLLLISQTKDPIYGFTLMLFFALGFGSPYVALGALSQNIVKLPKLGAAMDWIKYVFAALMFGLSLYYIKPLLSRSGVSTVLFERPDTSTVVSVALFTIVCYFITKQGKTAAKIGRFFAVLALTQLALWFTLFLTSGFSRASLTQSAALSSPGAEEKNAYEKAVSTSEVPWIMNWNEAINKAAMEDKPIVVDAWAEWCTACLQMDETLWRDPEVVRYIRENFVAAKIDFTQPNATSDRLTQQWDLTGLPAIGFIKARANPNEGEPHVLYRAQIDKKKFFEAVEKLKQ